MKSKSKKDSNPRYPKRAGSNFYTNARGSVTESTREEMTPKNKEYFVKLFQLSTLRHVLGVTAFTSSNKSALTKKAIALLLARDYQYAFEVSRRVGAVCLSRENASS